LAVDRHIAASTQNQALSALLFLYKEVLRQEIAPGSGLSRKTDLVHSQSGDD
jgi:Phage integrase, N-terminal SAM-like domain